MLAISSKPVIIICMRIEKDFLNDGNELPLNATNAMQAVTDVLAEMLIFPAIENDQLDEEDAEVLSHIRVALDIIAKKAQAWEDLQSGFTQDKHSKN